MHTPRNSRRESTAKWLLAALLGVLAGIILNGLLGSFRTDIPARARDITPRGDLAGDERTTIQLFQRASPSVVHITTIEVRRYSFSLRATEIPKGTGSGIIWDKEGHVVTNYHVIKGANAARVTLSDQSSWDASLVGVAPDNDLAVIRIGTEASVLQPVPIGTSSDLQVGQNVLAIGNPFGLDQTLTTGVISGLNREILSDNSRPISGVIQTDAAINPGNSGGPLLDSAGRLIGVNTAIFSPSGAYAGIGFAVPVDTVNHIVPQLIKYGKVKTPGLGIEVAPEQILRRLDMEGVQVMRVLPNGAAASAGILPSRIGPNGRLVLGDIIVAMGDIAIRNKLDLFRVLNQYEIGDTVTVTVIREREKKQFKVTLQELSQ
ncbi:MAG: trypsin-like peptidase domain-containing protein [Planctomycetota bacterium]|nr:trypsin-like peptidase domain-containing protein [Planctomycetota bacterium]